METNDIDVDSTESESAIRRGLDVIQSMIDISADRLEKLRTQCATSAELTQQEIRTLETKLVKMFSEFLLKKKKLTSTNLSSVQSEELYQWLRIVGLTPISLQLIAPKVHTLEDLLNKSDQELRELFQCESSNELEVVKLTKANCNLNKCFKNMENKIENNGEDLFWDSWICLNPKELRASPRCTRPKEFSRKRQTPPTSPGFYLFNQNQSQQHPPNFKVHTPDKQQKHKNLTPPANKRHQIGGTNKQNANEKSTTESLHHLSQEPDYNNRYGCGESYVPDADHSNNGQSHNNQYFDEMASHHANNYMQQQNHPHHHHHVENRGDGSLKGMDAVKKSTDAAKRSTDMLRSEFFDFHPKKQLQSHSGGGGSVFLQQQHQNVDACGNNNKPCEFKTNEFTSKSFLEFNRRQSDKNAAAAAAEVAANAELQQQLLDTTNKTEIIYSVFKKKIIPRMRLHTDPDEVSLSQQGELNALHSRGGSGCGNDMKQIDLIHKQCAGEFKSDQNFHQHRELKTPVDRYAEFKHQNDLLQVPKSPQIYISQRSSGMGHTISHRFQKKFNLGTTICNLCNKQMFFGLKCKECKYKCHKDCEPNVPPSCGLPREYMDEFKKTLCLDASGGGVNSAMFINPGTKSKNSNSSNGSSCNSSSPSSPALALITPKNKNIQFQFPDVKSKSSNEAAAAAVIAAVKEKQQHQLAIFENNLNENRNSNYLNPPQIGGISGNESLSLLGHNSIEFESNEASAHNSGLIDTNKSNESEEKTISFSSSSSSEKIIRLDSIGSSEDKPHDAYFRQNSLSLKEWDIPYDDLHLLEKIGKGRFGTVHRALWHGDVAVKLLKEDYLDDDKTLENFKSEVATFKKTRHENVVLFMGACMKPQAIVTSLCKGNTLYTHIHLRKDRLNLNRTTLVAQQISQGMGYLHARGIIHKDLKTKNIFLENGKVIITDFGLFNSNKLQYSEKLGLSIPQHWLCYLSPEIVRNLKSCASKTDDDELPFSKKCDVFAFGTVWYELLCGEFPFKAQPPEAIIFQVGKGMKQTLANLQATRDVKDILMLCWSYQADDRPDFQKILNLLEKLPKKRLARSPSHPVQLSRSAESVF